MRPARPSEFRLSGARPAGACDRPSPSFWRRLAGTGRRATASKCSYRGDDGQVGAVAVVQCTDNHGQSRRSHSRGECFSGRVLSLLSRRSSACSHTDCSRSSLRSKRAGSQHEPTCSTAANHAPSRSRHCGLGSAPVAKPEAAPSKAAATRLLSRDRDICEKTVRAIWLHAGGRNGSGKGLSRSSRFGSKIVLLREQSYWLTQFFRLTENV